jgi:regulator of protease activity HflC (stomatin/prohibitin superfamily)
VLHAQRLIDGEAKALSDRVMAAVAEVEARVTAYLRLKEAEIRRAAEAEAARLAAEAERLITEAQASGTIADADMAMESIDAADKAAEMANAGALELTRTRGLGGALTALRDNWKHRVTDIQKIPAHFLMVNDAAIRLAIRQGVREVPGLEIYNDTTAYIR